MQFVRTFWPYVNKIWSPMGAALIRTDGQTHEHNEGNGRLLYCDLAYKVVDQM